MSHAHFVCRECAKIYDIPIDISALTCPGDFVCDNVNVYFMAFVLPVGRSKLNILSTNKK